MPIGKLWIGPEGPCWPCRYCGSCIEHDLVQPHRCPSHCRTSPIRVVNPGELQDEDSPFYSPVQAHDEDDA